MKELLIGSHVSMGGKDMLLGSVKEALSYEATTFMFYTGAPQNTFRKPVNQLKVQEAKELLESHGLKLDNVVVHAPYIINLGNSIKEDTYTLAKDFLKQEIERCEEIGATRLVLHPGSHVKAGVEIGLHYIIDGLNEVLKEDGTVRIALETMSGKGSELGRSLQELKTIYDGVTHKHLIGLCLDTCHLHDAGYDVSDIDRILDEIEALFGKDKVLAIHINDSKNVRGASKDRHENIGYGYIGFETLNKIVHHPRLKDVPKILETPYVDGNAPYKQEIAMFRKEMFIPGLKETSKS